jgi:anaerobic selenocysteine-containing dehydrogenase
MTDTARYADLVLPATTAMEHLDLYASYGHLYVQLAEPVLPPPGEARSNWAAFGALSRALGTAEAHYSRSEDELIRETLAAGGPATRGITLDRLRQEGSVRLDVPRPYRPFADGAPTPSGKVEFYSAQMARAGLPPLPTYVPLREGPANLALAREYPLQCIVPPNRFFLNSSFSQSDLLRRRQQAPTLLISRDDAAARGIGEGDEVRVVGARGATRFRARVSADTRPGVVVAEGLWWHRFQDGGWNVNALTSDREADMGGGPALHSNLVEVEKGP